MSDWTTERLGTYARTFAGGTPDRSRPDFFGGTIPWVKSTEVNLGKIYQTEEHLSELGLKCSATKWIPENTVLVALYGATAAQVGFLKIKATANQAVLAICPDERLDSTYLFYSLTAAKARVLFQAQGSGQPNLNKQIIDNLHIAVPPLPQQRKIARILTTVDNLIEKTESLIAKYESIKQGMMHDLFTRGVDAHGQLRPPYAQAPELYKHSELGWIPNEWEVCRTGDCLERIEQGWSPDCDSEPASAGEWGVLKTTAVVWAGFDYCENKRLPKKLTPIPKYEVKINDVLMTRGGPNSRVGVVVHVRQTTDKLMLSDKIYRLVPKTGLLPNYFTLALSSERTQTYLSTLKTGLAESQTNISQEIVRRLWIGIPEIDEQEKICRRLDAIQQAMNAEMRGLSKLRLQKTGLMQDLLTGKVRVNADEENTDE
ncbi:MAG TPA: restriction endonuclease subunit S [Planctomycetaceae bacterium]|nr:restriction endonuclease subunit S [Planctomycetaceae bacterium]